MRLFEVRLLAYNLKVRLFAAEEFIVRLFSTISPNKNLYTYVSLSIYHCTTIDFPIYFLSNKFRRVTIIIIYVW